jgi:cytidylate kinase
MRIAISGLSGCGNTTVGKLVGATLGYPVFNYTFRDLAHDLGAKFEDVSCASRTDIFDLLVVVATIRAAQAADVIIGNRLATWVCDANLNIWLDASLTTRSTRISHREGQPYEAILTETTVRDEENRRHFIDLFCIDIHEHGQVDAIINTEASDAEDVAATIACLSRATPKRSPRRLAEQERILALLEERLRLPRAVITGSAGNLSLKALFEQCV